MSEWACVGCKPPHWENGVYIKEWTVHQDCRKHSDDSDDVLIAQIRLNEGDEAADAAAKLYRT